jgi:hypothetical protein
MAENNDTQDTIVITLTLALLLLMYVMRHTTLLR